jgi:hypothetical protein
MFIILGIAEIMNFNVFNFIPGADVNRKVVSSFYKYFRRIYCFFFRDVCMSCHLFVSVTVL